MIMKSDMDFKCIYKHQKQLCFFYDSVTFVFLSLFTNFHMVATVQTCLE